MASSSSALRTGRPARREFVIRLATRNDTPATGPICFALRGSLPMRLLLRAPAPMTPYSGRYTDARDILDSKLLDSIAELCGFLKLEFPRGFAHSALQLVNEFFALRGRQIRIRFGFGRNGHVVALGNG